VLYHRVNTDDIPSGTVSVLVEVDENGVIYHNRVVAGSAGIQGESRPSDCLQPVVRWCVVDG
jgi:hypothetical protein